MSIWVARGDLSLRTSLLLYLALPLVMILFIAGYVGLLHLEQEMERRMQEDLELIARAIRGPLEYSLEKSREGSVQQALDSLFSLKRVYGAYLYDQQGERIAASGARQPDISSGHLVKLAADGDQLGEYQQAGDDHLFSYFVPLADSVGRNIGLLQLTREGRDIEEYIHRIRLKGLTFIGMFSAILLAVLLYGHHRIVGRNLRNLVKSMARIERGDRHHRAKSSGPVEIRQLSSGMNAMLDSMARSELELEQQVQERDRLKGKLFQSQKMAAIGQLAAGVAHELGSPISVVSGKAQRMLRRHDLPEDIRQSFAQILEAVARTEHIVHQLLDFGRSNPLRKKSLPADQIVASAVSQLGPLLEKKAVSMICSRSSPIPTLEVDQIRIEQALVNLMMNAVQAVQVNGRIEYGWFFRDSEAGFYIADDGPGIPKEIRSRLFEPFFTTKTVGEGTGLGLSVAQAAVQDHGGVLELAESHLGGALFTMTFPRQGRCEEGEANHER